MPHYANELFYKNFTNIKNILDIYSKNVKGDKKKLLDSPDSLNPDETYFENLKETCYHPILKLLETFSIQFLELLFYKIKASEVKYRFQPFPELLLNTIDRFKTLEMVTDKEGRLSMYDPFLDSQGVAVTLPSSYKEPLTR